MALADNRLIQDAPHRLVGVATKKPPNRDRWPRLADSMNTISKGNSVPAMEAVASCGAEPAAESGPAWRTEVITHPFVRQ